MYDAASVVITLDNLAFVTKPNGMGMQATYARFAQATFRIGFLDEEGEFSIPVEVEIGQGGEDGAASLARRQLGHVIRALAAALG